MYIKNDMDFNDLMNNCWSGALDTLKKVEEKGKQDELIQHLEEVFETYFDKIPTMTAVNDYLWFDWENIFEYLGISDNEEDEDEEVEYSEGKTESDAVTFEFFCNMFSDCEKCPYDKKCDDRKECEKRFYEIVEKYEEED